MKPKPKTKTASPIFLDIMENDNFICQMKYTGRQYIQITNNNVVYCCDRKDIEDFVYMKRPSFRNRKDIRIEFSEQRV